MRIILSPAKKMNVDTDSLKVQGLPEFIYETERILAWMRQQSRAGLQALWKCNDKIADQNYERVQHMDLYRNLTPAVLSYEGLAYQYMAPAVFESRMLNYVQEHLRILSGFYGVLRPLDGVTPYRLEMQARAKVCGYKSLYELWGKRLCESVCRGGSVIVNLASKEYSKSIEKYLSGNIPYITVTFCERSGERLVTKGIYAKMARGEMVRYMAEEQITDPVRLKSFDRLGYVYRAMLSSPEEYVFERLSEGGISDRGGLL